MKIDFPQEWRVDDRSGARYFEYVEGLEVRRLPDSSAGEFLFAALPYGDQDYPHETLPGDPKPTYSTNYHAINFDENFRVRTASADEWGRAQRLLSKPRHLFAEKGAPVIEYRGLKFVRSGEHWGQVMLSPRGRWLAVFSYNGKMPEPGFFGFIGGGGEPRRGDVFWDVYDAETGAKVLAWSAVNVKEPLSFSRPAVWIEERFLLIPQGRLARTFLVGTLPRFVPRQNPVNVTLPARVGDEGRRVPASAQNEVWAPLAPLTQGQIAEITAPSPPLYLEVRRPADSSTSELLIAVREETENSTRHRPGRDGAGDYNYRLFSTYYYAVALDAEARTRPATREEWERARNIDVSRQRLTLEETLNTGGGIRRAYRPFPKTGQTWGDPRALAGGEWVAVFSHTPEPGRPRAGVMFVDVYSRRSGNLMHSARAPVEGSADALFGAALWVKGDYLIVPLSASLDSFQLFTLPGGLD